MIRAVVKTGVLATATLLGLLHTSPADAGQHPAIVSGPISAHATVEITDENGRLIPLTAGEQIAVMFTEAISSLEDGCRRHLNRSCPLDELVRGATAPNWNIGKLKYDPSTDPNYTYAVIVNGTKWTATATPKKAGLGGFFYDGSFMSAQRFYNGTGPASTQSTKFTGVSISGEIFSKD